MSEHSRGDVFSPPFVLSPPLPTTRGVLGPHPVDPNSHPLSPDPRNGDETSRQTFSSQLPSTTADRFAHPEPHHRGTVPGPSCLKRQPATIRSLNPDKPPSLSRTACSGTTTKMSRSSSSSSSTQGKKAHRNERNLIFDEWITSTAHPNLAAHSLIPTELIDDEKAIQDMLTEAMNEESFQSPPQTPVFPHPQLAESRMLRIERSSTPMSAVDIPVLKQPLIETRPRSSSTLSLRKWAGMIVGRGGDATEKRPVSLIGPTASTGGVKTAKRSFSDPESGQSNLPSEPSPTEQTSTTPRMSFIRENSVDDVAPRPTTPGSMDQVSSSESVLHIKVLPNTPLKDIINETSMLQRTISAPTTETQIPASLDQMRTEAIRSITSLRSPTRLRATTLTATGTRSRSGSESTVPKPHAVLSQSSSSTSLTSLGQRSPAPVVELEQIVPANEQPPSISARWDDHYKTEESGLTDRYGFIVGATPLARREKGRKEVLDLRESLRERTRSDEERWAQVTNEAEDRIEELLKMGAKEPKTRMTTFIEGWSTPVSTTREEATQASVVMADMTLHSPTTTEAKPTSPPTRSLPASTTVDTYPLPAEPTFPATIPDLTALTPSLRVSTPAPIPTLSTTASDLTTIKLLLSKLNDLHDSLDRANKQRWDKFLAQSENSPLNPDVLPLLTQKPPGARDRKARFRDFKVLVQGGIPVKYRSRIWGECSGAMEMFRPGYFEELCEGGRDGVDVGSVQQIEMDIHRTMPNNVFFGGNGPGIAKLQRILIAFARHNPSIGYCQGMNVITATLLLVHSTDEEAFWGLVAIIERILPEGYFTPDLIASRADQRVLKRLVRELCPRVHVYLQRLGVDLEAITFNWFLSVFTDCLPAEALFRVWDVFFVEGSAYIFRVALSVIKINEKMILACKSPAAVYSFMKDMTSRMLPIDKLINMSCEGLEKSVRNELIEQMRKVEVEGLKREMEEAMY